MLYSGSRLELGECPHTSDGLEGSAVVLPGIFLGITREL
jgi:hypothetical protein